MGRRSVKPRFWVFVMVALSAVFFCVYLAQDQFLDRQNARAAELETLRQQILSENAALERKIAFTKTEAYVERVAHDELGLVKENEIRFVKGN